MREIKFRAWDSAVARMFYGVTNVKVLNLMQYTGLKDRHGREIYEGDIIRICDTDTESEYIHWVVWGGEEYPAWDVKPYWDSECNVFSDVYNTGYFTIEVIGNIYEHSHLLK